jgi:hypothetical protein
VGAPRPVAALGAVGRAPDEAGAPLRLAGGVAEAVAGGAGGQARAARRAHLSWVEKIMTMASESTMPAEESRAAMQATRQEEVPTAVKNRLRMRCTICTNVSLALVLIKAAGVLSEPSYGLLLPITY